MAKTDKPNVLVIFGDDIGMPNLSCYSDGVMGYDTPNIDRLGKGGDQVPALLRRASRAPPGAPPFLTGQHVIRTGLTKVGFPGAPMGMNQLDPSVGGLLAVWATRRGNSGKTTLATATRRSRR